jgi:nitroreductase
MESTENQQLDASKPRIKPDPGNRIEVPAFEISEASRLMRMRRSIYPANYSGEEVPREWVEHILEDANWAPSHHHTEPWRFKVFTGKGLETFGQRHAELYRRITAAENFQQRKYDKLKDKPLLCSHLIAICMKRDTSGRVPEVEEVMAVAAAVQNLHLSATAHGLGGYFSTGGLIGHPGIKEILGLEPDEQCMGLFHLGRPTTWYSTERKSPASMKTVWIDE